MTTAASNDAQVRAARKAYRALIDLDANVVGDIIRTVNGRKWLWHKIAEGQLFEEDGNLDPMQMAHQKGKRTFALALLKTITTYHPNEYLQMTRENAPKSLLTENEDDGTNFQPDP